MIINEMFINKLRDTYECKGVESILPQNLDNEIIIQYIKTYEKFDQGDANLLEILFLTLFALWFTKNNKIEAKNIDLSIFYTYRYYYQCLKFSSKI